HTYAQSASAIPIQVTIVDTEGSTTTALSTAVVVQATANPSIREFGIPTPNGQPIGITRGPDGDLWFTERHAIGRITPAGVITEFSQGLAPGSSPVEITAGPPRHPSVTQAHGRLGRLPTPRGSPPNTPRRPPTPHPPPLDTRRPRRPPPVPRPNRSDRPAPPGGGRHRLRRWPHLRPLLDHGRAGRQPLVHRGRWQPDRPDHPRWGRHRVHRRHL